jgi:hypothetical protein
MLPAILSKVLRVMLVRGNSRITIGPPRLAADENEDIPRRKLSSAYKNEALFACVFHLPFFREVPVHLSTTWVRLEPWPEQTFFGYLERTVGEPSVEGLPLFLREEAGRVAEWIATCFAGYQVFDTRKNAFLVFGNRNQDEDPDGESNVQTIDGTDYYSFMDAVSWEAALDPYTQDDI